MNLELYIDKLPEISTGKWLQKSSPKKLIQQIIIDSRKNCTPETTLFVCLKGKRFSGTHFIDELYQKGLKVFVIEDAIDVKLYKDAVFYKVESTLQFLQDVAAWHRKKFNYPVIAITGSNGKTIVKEWLYHLLKKKFNIVRSPKSYNSQIGVSLSVLEMTQEHNLAIFEAGISMPGEMKKLERIIAPDYGVFTHLGTAHLENFKDQKELLEEKAILFKNCKKVVCPKNIFPEENRFFTWGNNDADLNFTKENSITKFLVGNQSFSCQFKFNDKASIDNLMSCFSIIKVLNVDIGSVTSELSQLEMPALRLEILEGRSGCQIINDTYNNDLSGLEIALDFHQRQEGYNNHVLIVSSMEGLKHGVPVLDKIRSLIEIDFLDEIVLIGDEIKSLQNTLKKNISWYSSTESFLKSKKEWTNTSILIKGSRRFKFEKIARYYSNVPHETTLEIDLSAVLENLNYFRSKLNQETKIMVMVKAAAYGGGLQRMAFWLAEQKIDALGVAYASEGIALREAGLNLPIMVLNPAPSDYMQIIHHKLEPAIGSLNRLDSFIRALIDEGIQNYPIHLELETGMNRLGVEFDAIPEVISLLKAQPEVQLVGVFSHFAASEDPKQKSFTQHQIDCFVSGTSLLEKALPYKFSKHLCNSQGILHYPSAHFDMVRIGLGLYGYGDPALRPAFTMVSSISQIKLLKKGETVSYGRTYTAPKNMKMGIIPVGYADGFRRALSNEKWNLLYENIPVPVLGQICMDMCMIDLTDTNAQEGDHVQVFGKGNELEKMAQILDTIPYEILTGISGRIMRVYGE